MFFIFIALLTIVCNIDLSCSVCNVQPEYKILNDGNRIPSLGFGTVENITEFDKVIPSVTYAIEVGFRLFDTAHLYGNEDLIGKALTDVFKRGIVRREDIFIITKLDISTPSREFVIPSLKRSLKKLRLNYVDLYLIHSPFNTFNYSNYDFVNIWKGMEDAKMLNLTSSIGISNFNSSHINRLLKHAKIRPAVNEIQVNPTFTNLDLVGYCQSQGIVVIAYAPFGFLVPRRIPNYTLPPTFEDPILVKIARKYGKQTSQVALRHLIDRGIIPIPNSSNRSHISSNIDLFDFSLTQTEVYTINEFNKNTPVYALGEQLNKLFLDSFNSMKSVIPNY